MNMLQTAKLSFTLPSSVRLTQAIGSIMQGVLMEHIDSDYAAYLHQQSLHPYSQYVQIFPKQHRLIWYVSALNTTASQYIIAPLLNMDDTIYLRKKKTALTITERCLIRDTTYEKLCETYFSSLATSKKSVPALIQYRFLTSTAFKSRGDYLIYPELRAILSSLFKRWNAFSGLELLNDTDLLDILKTYTFPVRSYHLSLRPFSLEGITLPAFQGTLSFSTGRNRTAQSILFLLSEYARFSGVGIKTAMGMGAVQTTIQEQ